MGKAQRIQVDRRMGDLSQGKDVRRFTEDACLACPHRTRNDQQRFRKASNAVQSFHDFRTDAME